MKITSHWPLGASGGGLSPDSVAMVTRGRPWVLPSLTVPPLATWKHHNHNKQSTKQSKAQSKASIQGDIIHD